MSRVQLVLLLLTVMLSSLALAQLVQEPEDELMIRLTRDKEKSMVKTLHMLQELDDFYSKLSRPSPATGLARPEKRDSDIKPKHYELLRKIDEQYAHRYRPRFGKRTSLASRAGYSEEEPSLLSRLLRQR
ncbi:uncharacterized protein LOC122378711 [Amphibalanus amphitrite]|uniref:uncharacterized protein LOC122378711 n=1 Tax=Amphibalanus amphitrite TaxID=1232801 RepID=UPI001C917B4B|nr:uncharacterized protein LOC122378711 [Amphibalanus amphitrite]